MMEGLESVPAKPKRITYRTVEVIVSQANQQSKNKSYTLDAEITRVTGIAMSLDKVETENRVYDLQVGSDINGRKVLPDDFEASLLYHSPAVPTHNRFLQVDEMRNGGKVEFKVFDRNTSGQATYPFTVKFILRCEQQD